MNSFYYNIAQKILRNKKLSNAIKDIMIDDKIIMERLEQSERDDFIPGAVAWEEPDGWRSWSYHNNKYYFNDVPLNGLSEALDILDTMELIND